MQPAEMTIGEASGQKDMCIAWDDMTRTDEFGYKSPLSEELTAKQADAINER